MEEKNKKTLEKDLKGKKKVKAVKEKKQKSTAKKPDETVVLNEKILRLAAEMQNMKRRYEDDLAKSYKYDGEELIRKMLPIVDNFERAIKLDDRDLSDEVSNFLSGFKMIYANLINVLESLEVKEIECKGIEFNPNIMEAVMTEKDDNVPANMVVEVLQKGYMYKDKLLRPAMVKVSE